eukprot:CAMPEP_0185032554 /NCGR_PEP_ID=MMETSP1103-20130426/20725_1 /TAXON_ID=36769 /ORGANISM="Paraphysomonas bandaiensis, Strain Caron Lab Isolate" /LENGTH=588 /DNA_ID=CAMNT_0027568501 /DNA_START=77 /DNA_END=1843 /DNA_ORIENTATION=+
MDRCSTGVAAVQWGLPAVTYLIPSTFTYKELVMESVFTLCKLLSFVGSYLGARSLEELSTEHALYHFSLLCFTQFEVFLEKLAEGYGGDDIKDSVVFIIELCKSVSRLWSLFSMDSPAMLMEWGKGLPRPYENLHDYSKWCENAVRSSLPVGLTPIHSQASSCESLASTCSTHAPSPLQCPVPAPSQTYMETTRSLVTKKRVTWQDLHQHDLEVVTSDGSDNTLSSISVSLSGGGSVDHFQRYHDEKGDFQSVNWDMQNNSRLPVRNWTTPSSLSSFQSAGRVCMPEECRLLRSSPSYEVLSQRQETLIVRGGEMNQQVLSPIYSRDDESLDGSSEGGFAVGKAIGGSIQNDGLDEDVEGLFRGERSLEAGRLRLSQKCGGRGRKRRRRKRTKTVEDGDEDDGGLPVVFVVCELDIDAGQLLMLGEALYVLRPAVYSLLLMRSSRLYVSKKVTDLGLPVHRRKGHQLIALAVALMMDLLSLICTSQALEVVRQDAVTSTSIRSNDEGEVDVDAPCIPPHSMEEELRRRKLMLLMYMLRSPLFDRTTLPALTVACRMLGSLPLVGSLPSSMLTMLRYLNSTYFYTADSS